MEDLFLQKPNQDLLDEQGVITLSSFLKPEELQALRDLYFNYHPDGIPPQMRDGIHMTIWCSDSKYKTEIREAIKEIIRPACERYFKDFRVVTPVFIVKVKGQQTTFPIHQDWSVVDETKHRAFNLWIPVVDVDAKNGGLWMVHGSHRMPTYVRGAGLLFPQFYKAEPYIREKMVPVDAPAGTGVLFYHRSLHGSPPNQSDQPRIAIAVSILPKEVPLHIYFQQDEKSPLEVYHPHDTFIYEFENVRDDTPKIPPKGQLVATLPPHRHPVINPDMITAVLEGNQEGWEQFQGNPIGHGTSGQQKENGENGTKSQAKHPTKGNKSFFGKVKSLFGGS